MKKLIISIPVRSMRSALRNVDEARKGHEAIDKQIAALPPINAVEHGMNAVNQRKDDLEVYEAQKREISKKAIAAIDEQFQLCNDAIDQQTMPTGADISGENEADFRLLEYGLVNSPAALSKLAEAHDAPGFRLMVQKYAKEHEWEGFDYIDSEHTVREFLKDFFWQCKEAARSPRGYYGMLLDQDKEIERQASARGLWEEYNKGLNA